MYNYTTIIIIAPKSNIMTLQAQGKKFLKAVGKNLNSIRLKQRKEIQDVAIAMRIRPQRLESLEAGEYNCNLALLVNLCRYYNIELEEVFPS